MSEFHRTEELVIIGSQPEVKKLWNGRYQLVFFCKKAEEDDTDYESISRILPTFGSLQESPLDYAPSTPGAREAYPDMRLVKAENKFIPATSSHAVALTYETITADFAQEKDDDTNYTESGLRSVSRPLIAIAGTSYDKVVGTSTISHSVEGQGEVTLYLASAKIDDTDAYRKVQEIWAEAGQLSESDPITGSDRIRVKTVVWQHIQGADPAGYVASANKTDNIGGFKTITSSYYFADDLSTEFTYETVVPFTMPGTVNYWTSSLAAGTTNKMLYVHPPIPTICSSTITESYSTSTTEVDVATLYQPNYWTSVSIEGVGFNYAPFASSATYSNHIAVNSGTSSTAPVGAGTEFIQGNRLFGGTTGYIRILGPSYDPAGNTIKINIDVQPAFRLLDGTQYYKKTVTEVDVPAR
jgi:hypothetical protein